MVMSLLRTLHRLGKFYLWSVTTHWKSFIASYKFSINLSLEAFEQQKMAFVCLVVTGDNLIKQESE